MKVVNKQKKNFNNLKKKYNCVICIENLIELKKARASFRQTIVKAKEQLWKKFLDGLDF